MRNPTRPSPPRSEAADQFLRCLDKIQAAEKSGHNPAPYVANARQWLAIVKLTSPREAAALESALNRAAGHGPLRAERQPAPDSTQLLLFRLAWLCVPFACLFMLAGGDIGLRVIAGLCLAGLLAFIFIR